LQEDGQGFTQALDAQQIVAIGRYLDLVDRVLYLAVLRLLEDHVVQFDAEIEAQLVELFIG
jgi:hypothetical protein